MKTLFIIIFNLLFFLTFSQKVDDSLVVFSDLKFHSEFEKEALTNFVKFKKDTFNMFLAIDENMNQKKAEQYHNVYLNIYNNLENRKVYSKKIEKKIKLTYSIVHSYFLKKYNDLEYFEGIFQDGTYNCVTASMLYSLILDKLEIPYKVQASSNHVYLVANPGEKSIVIETTNPMFQNAVFNGEFKKQYVNYLRESKLISEEDYKNKSVEEIFEQKFNEVRDAEFVNLPGFQYYNNALEKAKLNEIDKSYELIQKAYFFYPDNQVKILLNNILIAKLQTCKYEKVEDIDILVQFSRFKNIEAGIINGLMYEILEKKLQYFGNESFCDSLVNRFVLKCNNKDIINEVGFTYNMMMFQQNKNTKEREKYILNAVKYKPNHKIAVNQFNYLINSKLMMVSDNALLDTLALYEKKYTFDFAKPLLKEYKLLAYLRLAKNNFDKKRISEGNKYLLLFEQTCELPLNNPLIENEIEITYRKAALYYYYRKYKTKSKEYIIRGLKYVPTSELLKSLL